MGHKYMYYYVIINVAQPVFYNCDLYEKPGAYFSSKGLTTSLAYFSLNASSFSF